MDWNVNSAFLDRVIRLKSINRHRIFIVEVVDVNSRFQLFLDSELLRNGLNIASDVHWSFLVITRRLNGLVRYFTPIKWVWSHQIQYKKVKINFKSSRNLDWATPTPIVVEKNTYFVKQKAKHKQVYLLNVSDDLDFFNHKSQNIFFKFSHWLRAN